MNELQDLGPLGKCVKCGERPKPHAWVWYADAGSAHLVFCQDCEPDADSFDRVTRAIPVRLTDHRDDHTFHRLIEAPAEWFDND
jgi:hypothetical protein